jgi:hypothetical protein
LLVLLVSVAATEAKVELQAVALLVVVVHRGRRNRSRGSRCVVVVVRWCLGQVSIAEGRARLGGGD